MDPRRRNPSIAADSSVEFDPAIQALMSALIREFQGWFVVTKADRSTLELPMPDQSGAVLVALREPIGVGRIAAGSAHWRGADGALEALDVNGLLARLLAEPRVAAAIGLERGPAATVERFIARVRASATNLDVSDPRVAGRRHRGPRP